MKRGITPIIAIILLLMMTVAVSGAMFYWLSRVQGQTQGAVESFQSNLFTNIASEVSIIEANYNDTLEQLHIFLHNTGNTQITLDNSTTYPTTDWILFDSDRKSVCSTDWGSTTNSTPCYSGCGSTVELSVGQIREIRLNLTNSPCDITSKVNGSVFSFIIDFSGKATTAGSFVK